MRRTFSDHWYRIAELRLGLRPGVSVRLHHYRGEPWYVLGERAHGAYFRVSPTTWAFLSRLTVEATLNDIWRAAVEQAPEQTPGQEEVFDLVVDLYKANLIHVEGGVDEDKILERFSRKKKKNVLAKLSEMLFMRIPVWDPDPWLSRHRHWIALATAPLARWLALALVAWGVFEFVLAGSRAWDQASHILQPHNLLLLYLAVFVSHFLHEMAHAAVCKRFGGEVRTMGVMLLLLTPLPYVDLSSSWGFRDKYQRALVDGAGMLVDLLVGALATIVWAYTPPGTANELAYNLMFSTAIYTLLFNINPLMRFDGYYILSDLVQMPNLHEQAKKAFNGWWREKVLAVPDEEAGDGAERHALISFFVASNVYRLFVMVGIVLFVADQYFGIGLVVALALALTSFVLPTLRLLEPLRQPLFRFQQQRFLRRLGAGAAVFLLVVLAVPLPDSRVLEGVLEAAANTPLHTESGGIVETVHARHGQWLEPGALVVELRNPELDAELEGLAAQHLQAATQQAKALTEGSVDLAPIAERLKSIEAAQRSLQRQREALQVRAPHAGRWVDGETRLRRQGWLGRGAELGRVVDDRSHVFLGVIRQDAATALFDLREEGSRVRMEGERGQTHALRSIRLIPHSQSTLPSAALGPVAGRETAVKAADPSGKQAAEPFFLLRAELLPDPARTSDDVVRHGKAGWIKIRLAPQPLALQAWRGVSQFFQRRYTL
ncbi:MAG: hypothetical protein AAB176_13090 [Pseudomonadota bacterium]